MRNLFAFLAILLGLATAQAVQAQANATCTGHFPNPITDVCWGCFFPLSLGPVDLWPSDRPDADGNPSIPICLCGGIPPRPGLAFGFWEPVRMIDVTTKAFCFPNLGGVKINPGLSIGNGYVKARKLSAGIGEHTANYQVHYYVFPLFYLLELLNDFLCFEQASFDVAYMSEVDATWQDDSIAAVVYPETAVFAFPLAQVACVADCIAATAHLPLDALFWCSGCNGSMYPMVGNIGESVTTEQSMRLAAERMIYKMHRTGLAWGTMGSEGLCQKYLMPILKKQQYRLQMINPTPMVTGSGSCSAIGSSTALPSAGKTFPVTGEDVGYLVWRKRNCCVL
jgi:conjugal transfer pilus assembly protein TraU